MKNLILRQFPQNIPLKLLRKKAESIHIYSTPLWQTLKYLVQPSSVRRGSRTSSLSKSQKKEGEFETQKHSKLTLFYDSSMIDGISRNINFPCNFSSQYAQSNISHEELPYSSWKWKINFRRSETFRVKLSSSNILDYLVVISQRRQNQFLVRQQAKLRGLPAGTTGNHVRWKVYLHSQLFHLRRHLLWPSHATLPTPFLLWSLRDWK